MELLNVVTARAVWLFDISELNPRGKSIFPELFGWLEEEYHFEKVPKSITDVDDTKGLVFSRGNFQAKEEIFVDVELKIYNDGLVANSQSSTRDTEAFLESVLKSVTEEFSLVFNPEIIRRRMCVSELYAKSIRLLSGINPILSQLANKLTELVPGSVKSPFEVGGIIISPVQSITPQLLSSFRFERKANTSPDEHKYFSTAPMHTDDHLGLLDWFEQNVMTEP
ncbi:MAG TPA: hypothetical protein VMV34_06225 [Terriglobia bacterium]|nr:hypothetical protein [Terriglobia bacterium]